MEWVVKSFSSFPLGLLSVYFKLNYQVTNEQRRGILLYLDYIRNITIDTYIIENSGNIIE